MVSPCDLCSVFRQPLKYISLGTRPLVSIHTGLGSRFASCVSTPIGSNRFHFSHLRGVPHPVWQNTCDPNVSLPSSTPDERVTSSPKPCFFRNFTDCSVFRTNNHHLLHFYSTFLETRVRQFCIEENHADDKMFHTQCVGEVFATSRMHLL